MSRLLTVIVFLLYIPEGIGQDISNFTQFFINPYTLNPSYAGIEGRTAVFVGYCKQWASIDGAPVIQNFSLHTPLTSKVNFGLALANDKRGITQVSSLMTSLGYAVAIDDNSALRFALSVGYGYNSVDFSSVGAINDPALANLMSKNSFLIGNAGVSYHRKTFHAGLSMPNIFQPIYLSKDAFSITALKPLQAVVIHASNRFYFNNDQNIVEPYLIYRINGPLPSQYELATVVHLQHSVWVGASFKQQFGLSGLLGFKIQNQLAVGFSYSLKNSGQNQIPSPSYEIQIGYLVGSKKKNATVYSFVNTQKEKHHKKTAAEIAAARKQQQKVLDKKIQDDRKRQEATLLKQKEDAALKEQAKRKEELDAKEAARQKELQTKNQPLKAGETAVVKIPDSDTLKRMPRKKNDLNVLAGDPNTHQDQQHLEEQEKLKRLEVHADNPQEEHNNETVHPHAERHEFVPKGDHNEELDLGTYVIAGVFRSRINAVNFSDGLNKLSFTSDFGFLTAKGLWYVYIASTSDVNEAKVQRDKYRKMKIFKDSWLLTVHK